MENLFRLVYETIISLPFDIIQIIVTLGFSCPICRKNLIDDETVINCHNCQKKYIWYTSKNDNTEGLYYFLGIESKFMFAFHCHRTFFNIIFMPHSSTQYQLLPTFDQQLAFEEQQKINIQIDTQTLLPKIHEYHRMIQTEIGNKFRWIEYNQNTNMAKNDTLLHAEFFHFYQTFQAMETNIRKQLPPHDFVICDQFFRSIDITTLFL